MLKIHSFKNTNALITETMELLEKTLPLAGNLMLSGGSTPYVIYNRIARSPCPVHTERRLFLSDERMQPFDSENNNAHNLQPMLEALDCDEQFIRVDTTLPIEQASEKFACDLEPLDTIDLGLLGMGNDGHTAGFFTAEQARLNEGPLTLHTNRPDGMQGISVTPALLQRVEKLILLVTGDSKRNVINTLLTDPESIPAGIALSNHPGIELWTDLQL